MPDLSTNYLGLELKNPLVPSASPLSRDVSSICRLEAAGASAVVMYSLFEEQIMHESKQLHHYLNYASESTAEAMGYFPNMKKYNIGPEEYLHLISSAKQAVSIPLIGSLNGVTPGGWTHYAKLIEEAGADALELNIYYIPTDPLVDAASIEKMYCDTVHSVSRSIKIPLAVKIGPFFTATANACKKFEEAGAKGLVLFNRFYQPDIDIDGVEIVPNLVLSDSNDLRLPLRWTAILFGKIPVDLAVTSGICTHEDVIKVIMAGANVAQMASELLRNGPGRLGKILEDLTQWMQTNEYVSIRQMRGSLSQKHVSDPTAFERANYMKVLQSYRPDPTGRLL